MSTGGERGRRISLGDYIGEAVNVSIGVGDVRLTGCSKMTYEMQSPSNH